MLTSNQHHFPAKSQKWVLASHNPGKVAEFKTLLAPLNIEVVSASDLAVPDVAETGHGFVENALIKARWVSEQTGLPALADDSGLMVDVLLGEPGVYSARFAGEAASDRQNNQKLLNALANYPQASERTGQFVCVLALCWSAQHPLPIIAEGYWRGQIALCEQGENGFGYDSVFVPEGEIRTAAQLSTAEKSTRSHRTQALQSLLQKLHSQQINK